PRYSVFLRQSVLHIGDDWKRHHQRSADFQQRGRFDGLYVAPEMTHVVAKVAVPAAAWPGLEPEGHRRSIRSCVERPHLFEHSFEHDIDRRRDLLILDDFERLNRLFFRLGQHAYFSLLSIGWFSRAIRSIILRSARPLI